MTISDSGLLFVGHPDMGPNFWCHQIQCSISILEN